MNNRPRACTRQQCSQKVDVHNTRLRLHHYLFNMCVCVIFGLYNFCFCVCLRLEYNMMYVIYKDYARLLWPISSIHVLLIKIIVYRVVKEV